MLTEATPERCLNDDVNYVSGDKIIMATEICEFPFWENITFVSHRGLSYILENLLITVDFFSRFFVLKGKSGRGRISFWE